MAFRSLLRAWLQNSARGKIRDKVWEAARGRGGGQPGGGAGDSGEAERMWYDVAVVFALRTEAGGLRDRLSGEFSLRGRDFVTHHGQLAARPVLLVQSGPGREAAGRATRAVIAAHRPRWVVSAGFAGGLAARAERFDVVMAQSVVDTEGHQMVTDLKVDPVSLSRIPGVHVGRLLSVDRIVRKPEQKRALGKTHQALAVDMESFGVAEACREARVAWLGVRVISDPVDETLPEDVEGMLDQQTRAARFGAVVGAVWRRPGSVKDMFRLKENGLLASERLAQFLASMIGQLTADPDPAGG